MIHCVLIINTLGQPRLAKFYTPLNLQAQQALMRQVYTLVSSRKPTQSSFLALPEMLQTGEGEESTVRVISRLYATLHFVFIVDEQENELAMLDLMQIFVRALDKCFANVCELDLVFGWEVLEAVLEELIQGGMVLETKVDRIVEAVDSANNQQVSGSSVGKASKFPDLTGSRWGVRAGFQWGEDPIASASKTFSDAASTLRSYFPGR